MRTQTEIQIIQLLQERDESALKLVEQEYGRLCRKVSADILDNQQDAEECFNDSLMRLWNSIPPNLPSNLRAYLITIVRRLSIDRYNKGRTKRRIHSQLTEALDELEDTLAARDNVEKSFDQKQLIAATEDFIRSLPHEQGKLFLMRYYQMLSINEIAEACGISVGNTKVILMRTRKQLRKHLSKEGLL